MKKILTLVCLLAVAAGVYFYTAKQKQLQNEQIKSHIDMLSYNTRGYTLNSNKMKFVENCLKNNHTAIVNNKFSFCDKNEILEPWSK